MSEMERHCPFLNRDDPRCAEKFTVNRLNYALAYCCDAYQACGTYQELLGERNSRRAAARRAMRSADPLDATRDPLNAARDARTAAGAIIMRDPQGHVVVSLPVVT